MVADNTQQATAKAKDLAQALQSVKMDEFSDDAHTLWMRTQKDITALTAKIVEAKNISQQRDTFALLSDILFPILQNKCWKHDLLPTLSDVCQWKRSQLVEHRTSYKKTRITAVKC